MKRLITILYSALLATMAAHAADFVVDQKGGEGCFRTVQEAINAAPDYLKQNEVLILIHEGIYKEKVTVPPSKQHLHLKAEGNVVITWDDFADRPGSTGYKMGTSATSTVFLYGNDFLAEGITFENTAGEVGQACAITVDADKVAFIGCRFLGNQDTIYTYGGGQRQFFLDCYIEGTTDFIFGASTCWFENCVIHSKRNSYVTAASTPSDEAFGYVFHACRLTAAEGVDKCYLGRPWRKYAKTVFIDCELGSHIRQEGWHDWSKPYAHKTCFYAESGSHGPGAAAGSRVSWSHQLSRRQLKSYTIVNVMSIPPVEDKTGALVPSEWWFKVF